ncbi:YitT family protein [Neobacillus sp. GCM10023253]|uniref:YitT family protein n=1 Tax=Neobacillus sp. GCM10023253 TaxID=3252644 RepID=UPI0036125AA8
MRKPIDIFLGCLVTSIGVILLKHANIVTGGTAGLSLSVAYLFNLPFAVIFFLVNIPFYIFSVFRMGWKFTLNTVVSVSILTLLTEMDQWLPHFSLPIWIGSILGGFMIGIGLTILFMNGASLGGANILALYLQKRFQFNPGKVNFLFDAVVVLSSIYAVGLVRGLCSILSIAVTAKVISYFKNDIANKSKTAKRNGIFSIKTAKSEAVG